MNAKHAPRDTLITVYGGSGFLGRHVVRALAKRGYRIRVAVRRPELAGHLQPLGARRPDPCGASQCAQRRFRRGGGARRGRADQSGRHPVRARTPAFQHRAHYGRRTGCAAPRARARRALVHVSAIGADENSPSLYARSKAAAERAVLAAHAGGDDHAAVDHVRAGGRLLQPLRRAGAHVAGAAADRRRGNALPAGVRRRRRRRRSPTRSTGKARAGTVYELGGPEVRTFKELMQFVLDTIERKRLLVPLPFFAAKLQASVLQFMPTPPLTPDQVEMLRVDNVVSEAGQSRRPHAASLRHQAGADGSDRAVLSLALPQDRPVPQPRSLNVPACPIITNIEDLRQLARRKVPRAIFDYVDRGSYDEISYRANTDDLQGDPFPPARPDRRRQPLARDDDAGRKGVDAGRHRADRPDRPDARRRRDAGGARGRGRRHPLHALHHVDLLDRGRALGDQGAVLVSALRLPRPRLLRIGDRTRARAPAAPRCSSPSICRCAASATPTSRTAWKCRPG